MEWGRAPGGARPLFFAPSTRATEKGLATLMSSESTPSADATGSTPTHEVASKPPPRRRSLNVRRLARVHAEAAVAALAAVMTDAEATPAARVSAASALLGWGYGRSGSSGKDGGEKVIEKVVEVVWGGEGDS